MTWHQGSTWFETRCFLSILEQVRLNVSRGLGLSLNITGNDVRVKGFSSVKGDEIGPAQACGKIQVGDALVCVNHEQLTLLNHENVVRVLRGLLSTTGSQVLLLRFAYAEDSTRLLPPPPPAPPLPPKTPKPVRHSSLGNTQSEPRLPPHRDNAGDSATGGKCVDGDEGEAFRPESWHGSMRPQGSSMGAQGLVEGGPGRSSSASPPHTSGTGRVRSHSLGGGDSDSPSILQKGGSNGERGGMMAPEQREAGKSRRGWTAADAAGRAGVRPDDQGKEERKRRGGLWGEREMGLAGGDGGSRHLYLADMGHARAERILQLIAKDVQVLAWLC